HLGFDEFKRLGDAGLIRSYTPEKPEQEATAEEKPARRPRRPKDEIEAEKKAKAEAKAAGPDLRAAAIVRFQAAKLAPHDGELIAGEKVVAFGELQRVALEDLDIEPEVVARAIRDMKGWALREVPDPTEETPAVAQEWLQA
ncbi:hypothetical protein VWS50_22625, partial [Xanthomonas citri pv. citri]